MDTHPFKVSSNPRLSYSCERCGRDGGHPIHVEKVRTTGALTVQAWIAQVDLLRETDILLARGAWHGYLNESTSPSAHPLRGAYVLARWKPAPGGNGGSVVIAHDEPERVVALAHRLEEALYVRHGATSLVGDTDLEPDADEMDA